MTCKNRIRTLLVVTTFSLILAACGGGGGDSGSTPTPTPTPTPQPADPTITVTQENTTCEVATECLVLSAHVSESATGASFSLNGVESAEIEIDGNRTEITEDGDIAFTASQSFKLYVTHSVGETLTFGVDGFTVNGTSYSSDNTIDIEFSVPEANALLDTSNFECDESTCSGIQVYVDTPINGVKLGLENGVTATIETPEGVFVSENGSFSFPATSEIEVHFPIDHFSVQQRSRLTEVSLESVAVSGNVQSVGETLPIVLERPVKIIVKMYIPTIYGGALVTTDPAYEVKAIKQIVQFGPGFTPHQERVLFDNVTYTLFKWNDSTEEFDTIDAGQIVTASGLTLEGAETLYFNVDTTPWVYRVEVTGTLEGGDTLTDSKTFVKRDESMMFFVQLFPDNVSGERLTEIHTQYDALDEGTEFSSTLANLYPREYMDEFGNINPSTCAYAAELMGMFPSVDTAANVEIKTFCNVDTPFSIGNIATETSMVLNISSQEHPGLAEVDFTLPADSISMPYEAKKGSNVVDWKFHSFASPGSVEVLFSFPTNNTVGLDTLIEFDVSN